jgi:hypothetical protein
MTPDPMSMTQTDVTLWKTQLCHSLVETTLTEKKNTEAFHKKTNWKHLCQGPKRCLGSSLFTGQEYILSNPLSMI